MANREGKTTGVSKGTTREKYTISNLKYSYT